MPSLPGGALHTANAGTRHGGTQNSRGTEPSWADWSTIAAFRGLLGGIVIIFAFSKDKPCSETILSFICGLVTALGVYGEYRYGSQAARGNAQLQTISDRKVADLTVEASNAQEMAEAEKLERIKLEAIVAPRSLSLEQQQLVASACSKFRGHGVLVSSYGMDGEAAALAGQNISALRSEGIIVADARASIMVTGGFEVGIHVRGPDVERDFVSSLGNALRSIGKLEVSLNDSPPRVGSGMGGGGQSFPPGTVFVTVMVGTKPVPILVTK